MSKNPYVKFSSDLDFSKIDHIIIGSGVGGLTAATWLAKAGKKVAIFEQHYVPGGFTHSFKRKQGYYWDVGLHYIGNVGKNDPMSGLFDYISDNTLDWESMGAVYDVAIIGKDTYEFRAGKENFRKQLTNYFPEEKHAIDNYLDLIEKVNKRANIFFLEKTFEPFLRHSLGWIFRKRFHKFSNKTTYEVLANLTNNKRLIAVLCAQCGNYGLSPKESSFAAHAIVINHFMNGGYYPKGGSDQIPKKVIDTLKKYDADVYINAKVDEIVVEKNRVKGIRLQDTFIPCKSVISNIGVNNTFNGLLTDHVKQKCKFNIKQVPPSTGHLCLYVGLNASDEELQLPKHNVWSFKDDDIDAVLNESSTEDTVAKFAYISFPSAKDPLWKENHPNKATIQAIAKAEYSWFTAYENQPWMKREQAYQDIKKKFEKEMLEKLYDLFPQIKGHVAVTEVSSPLSTKHFSNYKNGEIYGLAHTPERFKLPFLKPETGIKGLRLTGQDITIVGVAAAMLSGMLTAITILKFKTWKSFKQMNETKRTYE